MTLNFTVEHLEIFLLILVRISAFIVSAPFFSQQHVPRQVKAGLAVYLSFLIYAALNVTTVEYNGVIEFAVNKERITKVFNELTNLTK